MSKPSSRAVAITSVVAGVFALICLLTVATTIRSWIVIFSHWSGYWLLPVLAIIALMVVAIDRGAKASQMKIKRTGYNRRDEEPKSEAEKRAKRWCLGLVAGAVVAFGLALFFWMAHPYGTNQQYLSAVKVERSSAVTTVDERVPYQTAGEALPKNLGDLRGDMSSVTYVNGRWTALVTKKGAFVGLDACVSWSSPINGDGKYDPAKFRPTADRKLDGWWSHSLMRAIRDQRVGAMADSNDAYCYVDAGKPYYVVPLTRYEGWIWPHEVPAGTAIVDENGTITIKDTVAEGEIPGPVYPSSLAKRVREANAGLGSMTDQWFDRAGYEASNVASGVTDNGAATDENAAELVMYRDQRKGLYMTPLTPRGASKSVTAVTETDATSVTAGRYNKVVIRELDKPRKANGEIEKEIKAKFARLEWASGLKIFEVAPRTNDEWLVSLGQSIEVMYRVHVRTDGSMIVRRVTGEFVDGVNKDGKPTEEAGNLVGAATTTSPVTGAADLSKVSTDDLLAEVRRRIGNQPAR